MGTERRYWLTTHWPQRIGKPFDPYIYVQAGQERDFEMQHGDHVLVYELATGPLLIDPVTRKRIRNLPGAQAITYAVEVISNALEQRPDDVVFHEFVNREPMYWKWAARTKVLAIGDVARSEVNKALGYAPKYVFMGFGGKITGLGELSQAEYTSLYKKLCASGREL